LVQIRVQELNVGPGPVETMGMSEILCPECGSDSFVESGVFEHGTWIRKLTCWTCNDCRAIVAIPEEQLQSG
jgi:hypothetical protein